MNTDISPNLYFIIIFQMFQKPLRGPSTFFTGYKSGSNRNIDITGLLYFLSFLQRTYWRNTSTQFAQHPPLL